MQQLVQRTCLDCSSVKTSLTKDGIPNWHFLNKDKSKPICNKCYKKRWNRSNSKKRKLDYKKWKENNPDYYETYLRQHYITRINFKGKAIFLETNPRIGTCSNCGRSIAKGEIEKTNMHHIKYDPKNPEAYTIELCTRCHSKEHARLRRL